MKMAAMRQVEPWFMDFKKIMDMVLRSGEIQLWVSRLGMGWLGGGCLVGRDVGRGEKCHS